MNNFDLMLRYYKNKKAGTRNFYDSNQSWTDFTSLDLSQYNSLKIKIVFKVPTNYRGNANYPIFGAYEGDTSFIFISRSATNKVLIYTYQSSGRYVFIPSISNVATIVPDSWNYLEYEVSIGNYGKMTMNENVYEFPQIFDGFPTNVVSQVSIADCYIKEIKLFNEDNLIWKAKSSDLR